MTAFFDTIKPSFDRLIKPNLWTSWGYIFLGLFFLMTLAIKAHSSFNGFDAAILQSISYWRSNSNQQIMLVLSGLGSFTVVSIITALAASALWIVRDRRASIYMILGPAGAGAIGQIIKFLISRPRPSVIFPLVETSGFSYPSGHALASTSLFLLLAFMASGFYRNHITQFTLYLISIILIFAIDLSRLYLGVHYPSDVISGTLLGGSWAFFLIGMYNSQKHREHVQL